MFEQVAVDSRVPLSATELRAYYSKAGGPLLGCVLLLLVSAVWLKRVLQAIQKRMATRKQEWESSFSYVMYRPIQLLIWVLTVPYALNILLRPLKLPLIRKYVLPARSFGILVAVTWFLLQWVVHMQYKVFRSIDAQKGKTEKERKAEKAKVDAIGKVLQLVVVIITVLFSLEMLGVNIQAVLAFGGIGGVAIGLAGREIIANFFAGLMIYFTQPFSVGDWIQSIPDNHSNLGWAKLRPRTKLPPVNSRKKLKIDGTVEEIGWYLTRLRGFDKRPIYVPNALFSTLVIINASRMTNRRIEETIQIRQDDVAAVKQIVQDIRAVMRKHAALDEKQHRIVFFSKFSEYAADLYISAFTKTIIHEEYLNVKQDILLTIYDIISKHGAKIASSRSLSLWPPPTPWPAQNGAQAPSEGLSSAPPQTLQPMPSLDITRPSFSSSAPPPPARPNSPVPCPGSPTHTLALGELGGPPQT